MESLSEWWVYMLSMYSLNLFSFHQLNTIFLLQVVEGRVVLEEELDHYQSHNGEYKG